MNHRAIVLTAISCNVITACGDHGDSERANRISESIVDGTVMSDQAAASRGLVYIYDGLCTGVLLNNSWALTAQHCVWGPGVQQKAPTTNLNAWSADTASQGVVVSDRFYSFGPEDVILLHLPTPIAVNGSTTGFTNSLATANPIPLLSPAVTCMGQGASVIGPPKPTGQGKWRSSTNLVTAANTDTFTIIPEFPTGGIAADGDSGGPCFDATGAIAGIMSNVDVVCGGVPCGSTSLPGATIVDAHQTSTWYLGPSINGIMSGAPAIQGPALGVPAVIQSTYGTQGNFELVAPTIDGKLVHYWRNNSSSTLGALPGQPTSVFPWALSGFFGASPGHYDGVALTESFYSPGPFLEAVATSGGQLYVFERGPGSQAPWGPALAIPGSGSEVGRPAVVQSTYNSGCKIGNLEVAVPNALAGVDYFWRDNCTSQGTWHRSDPIAASLGAVFGVSLIESHWGTMEMVIEVALPGCQTTSEGGLCLYHLTRDASFNWGAPVFITGTAGGPPSLATSNFGNNGNFELAVPSVKGGIDYYFKVNDPTPTSVPWQQASPASQGTGFLYRGVTLFESNLGNSPGNMELFAARIVGDDLLGPIDHTWRPTLNFTTTGTTTIPPSSDWRWVGPFEIESP